MPLKDDLLQRTVEQIARALALLAGRVHDAAAAGEVRGQLESAYRDHLGVAGDTIRRLSTDQLVGVLSAAGALDGDRAFVVAALLELDAEIPEPDEARRAALRMRALELYAEAGAVRVGQVDLPERVRRLRSALRDYQLPGGAYVRLIRYLEADGRLAEAEDLLFEWLEDGGATRFVVAEGRAFYERLLARDDAALEAGQLPRAEVREGIAAFEATCAAGSGPLPS
jgi:tetratricopeptide (TPR) repeat protein